MRKGKRGKSSSAVYTTARKLLCSIVCVQYTPRTTMTFSWWIHTLAPIILYRFIKGERQRIRQSINSTTPSRCKSTGIHELLHPCQSSLSLACPLTEFSSPDVSYLHSQNSKSRDLIDLWVVKRRKKEKQILGGLHPSKKQAHNMVWSSPAKSWSQLNK